MYFTAIQPTDTIVIRDTIVIYDVPPEMISTYTNMLENANQQLGNAFTPAMWILAALGILFTAGAVVAGFLIYRQSKDYKDDFILFKTQSIEAFELLKHKHEIALGELYEKQKKIFENQRTDFLNNIVEKHKKIDEIIKKVDKKIDVLYQKEDKDTNQIDRLEKELQNLKSMKKEMSETEHQLRKYYPGVFKMVNEPINIFECQACNSRYPGKDVLYFAGFDKEMGAYVQKYRCLKCGITSTIVIYTPLEQPG